MALETTRDPQARRRSSSDFATTSLSDPNPPTWAYLVFDDHPTLRAADRDGRAWASSGAG